MTTIHVHKLLERLVGETITNVDHDRFEDDAGIHDHLRIATSGGAFLTVIAANVSAYVEMPAERPVNAASCTNCGHDFDRHCSFRYPPSFGKPWSGSVTVCEVAGCDCPSWNYAAPGVAA